MMLAAMMDQTTTIAELRELVRRFVAEREWEPFHAPKNLSMSLAIEAAELMEHFQWIDAAESRRVADDPAKLAEIRDELADVLCYALALANALDLDLSQAVHDKMVKNAVKYPAEQSRGRFDPPTPYELGKDLFGGDPSGRSDLSQNAKQIVREKVQQRSAKRRKPET